MDCHCRLYGSYAAIQGTSVNWALQDLTGGLADSVVFRENRNLLKRTLDLSMARSTLLAATITVSQTVLMRCVVYSSLTQEHMIHVVHVIE